MYTTLRKKWICGKAPFHQKVLHFQYEKPIDNLRKAYNDITSQFDNALWTCTDTQDGILLDATVKTLFSPQIFEELGNVYGIFDETETYYIRLVTEPEENAKENEPHCGNLYLFACDEMLFKISKQLGSTYGQLVLESTADYFALLSD